VAALFRLVRDATGRAGLAAALAFGFALLARSSSTSSSSTRRWWGRSCWRRPSTRSRSGRRPPAAPLALRPPARDAALAPPEVPAVWLALVATASWVAWRERTAAQDAAGPSGCWCHGREPVPDRALQLRDHRQRPPRRALPRVGAGRVTSARWGRGSWACCSTRVRDPALRAGPRPRRAGLVLGGARTFAVVMPAAAVYYLTVASPTTGPGPCATSAATSCRWPPRGGPRRRRRRRVTRPGQRHRRGPSLSSSCWRRGRRCSPWRCGGTRTRRTTPPSCWRRALTPTATSTSPTCSSAAGRTGRPAYGPHRGLGRALAGVAAWWHESGAGPVAGLRAGSFALRRPRGGGGLLLAGASSRALAGPRTAPSFRGGWRSAVRAGGPVPRRRGVGARGRGDRRPGPGRGAAPVGGADARPDVTIGGQDGVLRAPGLPPLALRPAGRSSPCPSSRTMWSAAGPAARWHSAGRASSSRGRPCSGRKWNRKGPGFVETNSE